MTPLALDAHAKEASAGAVWFPRMMSLCACLIAMSWGALACTSSDSPGSSQAAGTLGAAGQGIAGVSGMTMPSAGATGSPIAGDTGGVAGVAGATAGGVAGSMMGGAAAAGSAGMLGSGGAGGAESDGDASVDGGAGASGADGGATEPPYKPCPTDGSPCKILPLGDSITWGIGDEANGGYRGPLFALTLADERATTFTGALSNGPSTVSGEPFPQRNEGHSGWGISRVTPFSGGNAGIATQIPNPAFAETSGGLPHIILLHIGTNDAGSYTASEMIGDLSGLLDTLVELAPDAYIVVAQIIPLGYGTNDVIRTYNEAIPGIVEALASAGKHVVMVDMFSDFDTSAMLVNDNIHPNTSGYEYMAERWHSIIGPLLAE